MKRRKLREESAQDEAPAIKQSKDKGLKENLALKQFLATRKEFSGLLDSLVAPHSSLYHDVFSTTNKWPSRVPPSILKYSTTDTFNEIAHGKADELAPQRPVRAVRAKASPAMATIPRRSLVHQQDGHPETIEALEESLHSDVERIQTTQVYHKVRGLSRPVDPTSTTASKLLRLAPGHLRRAGEFRLDEATHDQVVRETSIFVHSLLQRCKEMVAHGRQYDVEAVDANEEAPDEGPGKKKRKKTPTRILAHTERRGDWRLVLNAISSLSEVPNYDPLDHEFEEDLEASRPQTPPLSLQSAFAQNVVQHTRISMEAILAPSFPTKQRCVQPSVTEQARTIVVEDAEERDNSDEGDENSSASIDSSEDDVNSRSGVSRGSSKGAIGQPEDDEEEESSVELF